ncbi:MAG: 5-oxoprolinase [Betaproteobacteria bacterium RIFCSPLOWO2_12_FULL_62_13]|nr:MAG: 5-oxoprolinase [Betaproteobacteria bacterium RIFCSPLOWO2_12_FULL_62_13]
MSQQTSPVENAKRTFDPIAMEVFTNRLLSITETMAITMMRASFSPQIKERRDFSVGLFDRRGRLVAQGTHIPVHLGSLLGSVEAVLARYGVEDIREGDVYICNDPYAAGGTHLPDISIVTPIYVDGTLLGFAANIGHHSDVGGSVPGSNSAKARTIYEEGLRIPIIRIARDHKVDEDLLNLIALNSRLPEERALDLRVQISTNEKGVAATRDLIRRMGVAGFEQAIEDVLAYTLRRARRRIAELARGRHTFTTYLDDDGSGEGDRVPITATVFAEGDTLVVDLAGTGGESRGALNVAESALRATVYYCVKALLDHDLMANAGMTEAIVIRAPEGSIVNPRPPAACGARTITCQRLAGAIFGAFRNLLPREALIASSNDTLPSISFSGRKPSDGRIYLCGETLGGGGGARWDSDGMDGVHVHITNTLNMPTEALENEFPLLVEQYGLAPDSGGPGRHRGGLGIVRHVRALRDGTIVSARSDSHKQGAMGAEGGGEGGRGRLLRNPGRPNEEVLASKVVHLVLAAGESVRIETPGGAGLGAPEERPLEALAADLRDGIVSVAAAQRQYGAERARLALELARRAAGSNL